MSPEAEMRRPLTRGDAPCSLPTKCLKLDCSRPRARASSCRDIDMAGVAFSYSRDRKKLEQLASDAGANAHVGTPVEAAHGTDVLLLAVHWTPVDDVLSQAGAFQRGDEHE